jgi:FAD/FMN-containing dehydrogenase
MKTLEQFAKLAEQARQEPVPVPDVVSGVLRQIRLEESAETESPLAIPANAWPLWGAAAALLVIGGLMALNSLGMWSQWNGSVYSWLADFSSWRYL